MAQSAAGPGDQRVFSATYISPQHKHFSIVKDLQAPLVASVEGKTKYLNDLRKAVVATQEEVNKELTSRMEEDRACEGKTAQNAAAEEKEEENYGEENVEEDE